MPMTPPDAMGSALFDPCLLLALVAKFVTNLGGFSPQFGRFRGSTGLGNGVRQIIHDGRHFTFLASG